MGQVKFQTKHTNQLYMHFQGLNAEQHSHMHYECSEIMR